MSLNFMIHCGGTEVERSALLDVQMPNATRSYQPVAYSYFADLIEDRLYDHGFKFGEQAHALNHEGQQYFGMAELKNGDTMADDWALVAGWRTSTDKSIANCFVVGSQVFVCDNLAFSGEVQIGRKHTTGVLRDLPDMITNAVKRTGALAISQNERYAGYKEVGMKDAVVNHTIVQMFRQGIMSSSRIGKVVNEYYEPSHVEHLDPNGNRTNWTLFNAATEALKKSGLNQLPQRTIKLHNLMDRATEYAIAA